ncbi:hypothetical protein M197_gp09 [Haloarcula hispanica tailed virus 2]|uniref:Uncharacterized protein n=1 Tax=Haloarcula hispanica tailed virus 2 TaxID=1273751 RepID=R4T8H1_9CAUD|nr:hypothetical protein M197_gp09 [Haloarcula hispanica tailed virus 2]AGM11175.1 hypothetical protein HHTV2_8 [Haloarcula hispanica tailed virus 2]
MSRYYVTRETAPVHVWDQDDVEFIEPPPDEGVDPFYDPIAEPLCEADSGWAGHETEPMEDHAENLKAFVRGRPDLTCPGCVLALERRHALPESYRTDALEERISEWQAAQARATTSRSVPPGSVEADVVEQAREMIEDLREAGRPLEDLTLTVSPDVMDDLRAHTFEVAVDEPTSVHGVPVLEADDAEAGTMEPMTFETVSIDLEVDTDEMNERVRERLREDAEEMERQMKGRSPLDTGSLRESIRAGAPPTHPSSRSSYTPLGATDGVDLSLPDSVTEMLDMDPEELAERARAESNYEGGRIPPKYVPPEMDPAPVAGKYPGVSGVTKDADTWCLDCAVSKAWIDFQPSPTQGDVSLILRDEEWDYIPRCAECERPLDVPSLESGWNATGTFTGTCVSTEPVVLDDGHETVEVHETEPLGEDPPRLGKEYEVPIRSCTPAGEGEGS